MTPLGDTTGDLQAQLAAHYAEFARLAGGLAHEIKNPLSTISLNMELLAEDFAQDDSPRDRRAVAKIKLVLRECQRLQNLLDDFLHFARVREMKMEPTDLNEEVRRVLDFFRAKAAESKIEVMPFLRTDLPSVLVDREKLHAALLNLVINAEQAMPTGGQLTVATETTPRGVALHLIDSGCGMDERTQAKIFEPFFSTKSGGSGLGLPTTRKIIEAHGGTIGVQSDLGRGTRFTVELPVPPRIAGDARKESSTRSSDR